MLFSTQQFSFWSFYPNANDSLEGTQLLRWEHCRMSCFLKMFCSPVIIWRKERSLCQQSHNSWPLITGVTCKCWCAFQKDCVMRDGKFPPRPAPKALDDTEEDCVFDKYTKGFKSDPCSPCRCQRLPVDSEAASRPCCPQSPELASHLLASP